MFFDLKKEKWKKKLSFGSDSGHCWCKVVPAAHGKAGETQWFHLPALFFKEKLSHPVKDVLQKGKRK